MAWITTDPHRNGLLSIVDPERPEGERYIAHNVPWADAGAICAMVNGQRLTYDQAKADVENHEPF